MNELGTELDRHRGDKADQTANEDDLAEQRPLQPHRLIHAMDRKGRKDIEAREAGIAHLLSRMEQLACGIKLRGDTVDRVLRDFRRGGSDI